MGLSKLQHPNIVQLFEVGQEGGCPFFSLEYIDGDSLSKRIEGAPQPPRECARVVQALADATTNQSCGHLGCLFPAYLM